MTPVVESIAAAPAGPSLVGAGLRMLLAVAVIGLAAAAWFWHQRRARGSRSHLRVLDRAFLARGSSVALLRVDERRLLVGVSSDGVRLLRDMDVDDVPAVRPFSDLVDAAGRPDGQEERS